MFKPVFFWPLLCILHGDHEERPPGGLYCRGERIPGFFNSHCRAAFLTLVLESLLGVFCGIFTLKCGFAFIPLRWLLSMAILISFMDKAKTHTANVEDWLAAGAQLVPSMNENRYESFQQSHSRMANVTILGSFPLTDLCLFHEPWW